MIRFGQRRRGRPPGPAAGRMPRPWDPVSLSPRDRAILMAVHRSPGAPRWRIAQECGISTATLSRLTCSAVGQAFLEGLRATDMSGEAPPPPAPEVIPPPPPLLDEPIPVVDRNRPPPDWYATLLPSKDGGEA
jgi:hypothetical protein